MPIPKKVQELLSQADKLKDSAAERLEKAAESLEKSIIMQALAAVAGVSTNKDSVRLTASNQEKVRRLKRELYKLIAGNSAFAKAVSLYFNDFGTLTDLGVSTYNQMGFDVSSDFVDPLKTEAAANLESIFGKGMQANVIDPFVKHVANMVSTGADTALIEKEILRFFEGPKSATRYISTNAVDLVNQYDGLLSERIGTSLKLEWVVYSGSIIENSRLQCERWVGFRYMHRSEFQREIGWANRNGSGMIKTTTPATFTTDRGGYRCRHKMTYISSALVPQASKDRVFG